MFLLFRTKSLRYEMKYNKSRFTLRALLSALPRFKISIKHLQTAFVSRRLAAGEQNFNMFPSGCTQEIFDLSQQYLITQPQIKKIFL